MLDDLLDFPELAGILCIVALRHRPDLLLVRVVVLRQQIHELVVGDEVTADHGEHQSTVVAYVLAVI